jgi:alginate O-acetyltransferase complex protein AlgI
MLFNSIEYLFFLPIVFGLYWLLAGNRKGQNLLLLLASYSFYAYWDYRFLSLIILSSGLDFYIGKSIHKTVEINKRKQLLTLSVVANIGVLAIFKYFDFFIGSANDLFHSLGVGFELGLLEFIFPVGISFYTFQTLSYTIDVYCGKIEPTDDVISFFGFVSFFPQLVAGPIERAKDLLPQFKNPRKFEYGNAVHGMRQILWGMFKKVVLADNAAVIVDSIFGNYEDASPILLLFGASMFFIQVYGDFSGYSDIAIGTARLFGFKLSVNFSSPFFSRSVREFWRRWHITLNTWFRDYVYFPLGGNRKGHTRHLINIAVVFVICGFWHGPAWTFIIWGIVNAAYFVIEQRVSSLKHDEVPLTEFRYPTPGMVFQMALVFFSIALSLVFFRSPDIASALNYFVEMTDFQGKNSFRIGSEWISELQIREIVIYLIIVLVFEWRNKGNDFGLKRISRFRLVRMMTYLMLTLLCVHYFYGDNAFVYFQF